MGDTRAGLVNRSNQLVLVTGETEPRRLGDVAAEAIAARARADKISAGQAIIVPGKNLINVAASRGWYILNSVGVESANSSPWKITEYIGVTGGQQVFCTRVRFVAEYDVNKNFVAGTYKDNPGTDLGWTLNAATAFLRICYNSTYDSTMQLEYGVAATTYEAYAVTLQTPAGTPVWTEYAKRVPALPVDYITPKAAGKNIFDKSKSMNGTINSTGARVTGGSADNWKDSDFTEVSPSTQYVISKCRFIAEYDANKVFVPGTYQDVNPSAARAWITNASTKYVRFTFYPADEGTTQLEAGGVTTSFEAFRLGLWLGSTLLLDFGSIGANVSTPLVSVTGYSQVVDRSKYQVWKSAVYPGIIRAVHRDLAVRFENGTISFSQTGLNGAYDQSVVFDAAHFPGLIASSQIANIFLLPWTRNMTTSQHGNDCRCCVITDKGQIFHNYPKRSAVNDGTAVGGDMLLFEESVIWDLAERRYPSADAGASGVERYHPGLPAGAYEYHPPLNSDPSNYGHGGFDKSITINSTTYPRFYVPARDVAHSPFSPMGGFEPGDKVTLIGTYLSNTAAGEGSRVCLFATSDGGRSWFCRYEFGSQETTASWCNAYDLTGLATPYTADSFVLAKRSNVVPTALAKEPATSFSFGADIVISDITRAAPPVVTTATPHGLATGNVVVIKDNGASGATSPDWDWMRNDTASDVSAGTGMFFKAEVIDATTVKLHEFVHSPSNPLPARHIHAVNRAKDGWVVGAGEGYPAGWQLHVYLGAADSYDIVQAFSPLTITRLTSASTSVQRTLGSILLDDADQTYVFASDEATIVRPTSALPAGRTATVKRSSSGVFKGKLANVDDIANFVPIYEAKEPAFFFKEKAGAWIFCGQRGEFAISFDKGAMWSVENFGAYMAHFQGESKGLIVIDNFIVALK